MIKDRIKSFKKAQKDNDDDAHNSIRIKENNELKELFKEVECINDVIEKFHDNVQKVKKIHNTILFDIRNDHSTKELDNLMTENTRLSIDVRQKLKKLEQKIITSEQYKSINDTNIRIQKTQHSLLKERYIKVMVDYNECQINYREHYKKRLQRQIEITGNAMTDEQLQEMLETDNTSIFTDGIITDTQIAKQTLSDIQMRYDNIKKLEISIREIHDLYMDIMMIVEEQGETINDISTNISNANDLVENGKTKISKAKKKKTKVRKRKYILISIGTTVLAVLMIPLFI